MFYSYLLREFRIKLSNIYINRIEKNFIKHNIKLWDKYNLDEKTSSQHILVETIYLSSSIIAFSYLVNLLSKKYNAAIYRYDISQKKINRRLFKRKQDKIFRSFNADKVIYCDLTPNQIRESEIFISEARQRLNNKRDVESLRIENVWIGDLLYDSHLRKNNVPTLILSDNKFLNSLKESVCYYVFWRDYFKANDVKAVVLSHCVYNSAIILRIAVENGIPVYQINPTTVFFLTKENLRAYNESFDFPQRFRKLDKETQNRGLVLAKEKLERRFTGEVGVDMPYSTKSAFDRKRISRVLSTSNKIKILVATHCFFDSPHPSGVNLFPDFYEWLDFLGEISERTDYEWYIKTHPDFLPGNVPILEKFTKKYSKFVLIPAETSAFQILEEGIDFVLTVYGTIGFEYAALGVPVINASTCNPHVAYNFNFHPKSVKEYERILLNLSQQRFNISVSEVYEYYFMKFIYNTNNWLYENYEQFISEIGGHAMQGAAVSYEKFMQEFSKEKNQWIIETLNNFMDSKSYVMQREHFALN